MKLSLIAVILIGLTFQQKGTSISDTNFRGVMFPANFDILKGFSDDSYPGHFRLTKEMIKDMEKKLTLEIKELTSTTPNQGKGLGPVIHKNLNKYFRQYIGLIDENGTKYILINLIWATSGVLEVKDPLTSWIQVHDGGSNFWSIKYNQNTRTFYDVRVNGVA